MYSILCGQWWRFHMPVSLHTHILFARRRKKLIQIEISLTFLPKTWTACSGSLFCKWINNGNRYENHFICNQIDEISRKSHTFCCIFRWLSNKKERMVKASLTWTPLSPVKLHRHTHTHTFMYNDSRCARHLWWKIRANTCFGLLFYVWNNLNWKCLCESVSTFGTTDFFHNFPISLIVYYRRKFKIFANRKDGESIFITWDWLSEEIKAWLMQAIT